MTTVASLAFDLPTLLRVGGLMQLVLAGVNVPVIRRLDYAGNLATVSPIVRQIFWIHLGWILLTVLAFAGLDLAFAEALAGSAPVGRFASAMIASLWGVRLVAQRVYYDRTLRRANAVADIGFSLVFLYLVLVHGFAAVTAPLSIGAAS